ncbi:chitinase [Streptomyces oceani]|uniref:chitinase n=1 Tax=Streptomyces oceani TaxID=1075402 RepID=A0A1E7KLR9_9ACTN|nr:chitinase [Streptomyces oceani]
MASLGAALAATAALVAVSLGSAQAAGPADARPAAEAQTSAQSQQAAGSKAAVPAHAVTGYVQNFDNGAPTQRVSEVPDAYDIIAVAFADSTNNPGEITFNLDPALASSTDQLKSDIAAKQAEGKSVIISVGGEKGNVTINDDASAARFAESAHALMQEYGFDGVDIDLEHGINAQYMTKALQQLSDLAGPDMVLTMAPQTLDMQSTDTEYFKTALNVKDILTVVNMQYYNSGSMLGCDGKVYSQGSVDFLTALACIQLRGGLDASQVGLGTPASPSAAGSGYVDPAIVNDALDCLTKGQNCGQFKPDKTYPKLRGAMTWSTNWDKGAGNGWSNTVGPHVDALP